MPDDADDVALAGNAKQGTMKGKCREQEWLEVNEPKVRRTCTKMKRALERNQNAGKCKGKTRREPEDGNEKKLLELMGNEEKLKRSEGMCRKLT